MWLLVHIALQEKLVSTFRNNLLCRISRDSNKWGDDLSKEHGSCYLLQWIHFVVFDLYQASLAFHIETSHLISIAGLKWVSSRQILVRSERWKHQNNARNLFKVNDKDTRTTLMLMMWFWILYCWLWTGFSVLVFPLLTLNK